MTLAAAVRKLVFGISPAETTFARRGFSPTEPQRQLRLERVGETFVHGFNAALEQPAPGELGARLDELENEWRGFAYEGAAMALALLDYLLPWKRSRWQAFLEDKGDAHAYMVHVGAGWAAARLPWVRSNLPRRLRRLDPLLRWLVVDGYGFHEGYFHPQQSIDRQAVPKRLSGYARRAFDQGLGRSVWFVEGADVQRVTKTVGRFPPERHGDLFGGIGLACTYAGGVERAEIEALQEAAGAHRDGLAQGAAFAAKARQRAGCTTDHTELACQVLCGTSAEEAAAVTDRCLVDLPPDGVETAYEVWRGRIQEHVSAATISHHKPFRPREV